MSRDEARVTARVPEALKRKADNSPYTITEMIINGIESHVDSEMKIKSDLEKSSAELKRRKDELRRARKEYNKTLETVEQQARRLRELQDEADEYEVWLDDLLDRADGKARIRLNNDVLRAQDELDFYGKTVEEVGTDLKKRAIEQERDIKEHQFTIGTKPHTSSRPLYKLYRVDENGDIVEREQDPQHTTEKTSSTEWAIEDIEQFLKNGWSRDDINWDNVDGTPDDLETHLDADPVDAATAD